MLRKGAEGLVVDEIEKREALRVELAQRLNMEEITWTQKAREKWIKESDRNTKYFHCLASHKRRFNYIEELTIDGWRVRGKDLLKHEVRNFFAGLHFRRISDDNIINLEGEFIENEIYEALRDCNGNKAPNPDRFNIKFLQEFWYIIKGDVVEIFREMHETGLFLKSLNTTFLVLIAKKEGANNIKDFRPVSLMGCIYKLISNVLARRLARVLGEVIGDCQHAFIEGR